MAQKKGNTTAYREGLRLKILDIASPIFKEKGINAVKMDDIASELGISKRTLYELYSNKEDLLYECIKHDSDKDREQMQHYSSIAENDMELLAYFLISKMKELEHISPCFLESIHKYPKIVSFLNKRNEERAAEIDKVLKSGIENGYFIKDINYDILYELSDSMMTHVMQSRMYQKYTLKEILTTIITVQIRGCCTKAGMEALNKYMVKYNSVSNG